jgi:hypothetical protein
MPSRLVTAGDRRDDCNRAVAKASELSIISAMAKPFAQLAIRRRRGNPNWGQPARPIAAGPTEFEMQVRKLGLTKQTYGDSAQLRSWCEYNRNRCYIPEWLLDALGILVDPNFSS